VRRWGKVNSRSILITSLLFAVCCTGDQESAVGTSNVLEIPVADTIGLENGDERYLFGDICSVEMDSRGRLLVLDESTCRITRYSSDGIYMDEFAGMGSGPGEIMHPLDMTILSDGSVAVSDWEAWGVLLYDSAVSYRGFLGPMPNGSPLSLCSGSEGSIVGFGINFIREDDHPGGEYYLGCWKDSVSAEFRYLQGLAEVNYGDDGRVRASIPQLLFDSDPAGRVWSTVSSDSTYDIHLYSPEGVELLCIQDDWKRVQVDSTTRAALNQEAIVAGDPNFDPEGDLFAEGVTGVFCEDSTRVWIRLGTSGIPFFNVYGADGEFQQSVSIPDLQDPLFETDFCITGSRIVAWNTNPVDFPKIFILENPFSNQYDEGCR